MHLGGKRIVTSRCIGGPNAAEPPRGCKSYLSLEGTQPRSACVSLGSMVDTVSSSSVVTATNPLPTHIQPSPVEMEHVSTTLDIAKSGFARGILVQRSKMAIFG